MTGTQSLSERLRAANGDTLHIRGMERLVREAADALDAKDAEIEKWQKLTGQGIVTEHELRKKELIQAAALEKIANLIDSEADDPLDDAIEIARKALAAIRKEQS